MAVAAGAAKVPSGGAQKRQRVGTVDQRADALVDGIDDVATAASRLHAALLSCVQMAVVARLATSAGRRCAEARELSELLVPRGASLSPARQQHASSQQDLDVPDPPPLQPRPFRSPLHPLAQHPRRAITIARALQVRSLVLWH